MPDENNDDIEMVFDRFPQRRADILQRLGDADFRELCEHYAMLLRSARDLTDAERARRLAELTVELEEEFQEYFTK